MIPLLNLFREIVPLLAKRHRVGEAAGPGEPGVLNPADDARSRIREISPRELAKFKKLPLIVDVREKEEYFAGHIKGATNIRRELLEVTASEIAPDRTVRHPGL